MTNNQSIQGEDHDERMRIVVDSVVHAAADDSEVLSTGMFPELDTTSLEIEFYAAARQCKKNGIYLFLLYIAILVTSFLGPSLHDEYIPYFVIGFLIGSGVLVWLHLRERHFARRMCALHTELSRRVCAARSIRKKLFSQISWTTFYANDKPS
jgi:hypothetical protein